MINSTHEELLCQPLQINFKQFKIAITFQTAFNGTFNVTNSKNTFYFAKSFADKNGLIQIIVSSSAYRTESFNNETQIISSDEEHFTEANYPFTIKTNFSTLSSIIKNSKQKPTISFLPNDCIGNLTGFNAVTLYEEHALSPKPI